jgi:hypothetical protein
METLSDLHDTFVLTLWDLFDEWCVEHHLQKSKLWNNAPSIKSQVTIHVVLGAHPEEQTLAVLKKARTLGYKILLLDFKQSGFAKGTTPHDYSFLPHYLKSKVFSRRGFENNVMQIYPSISIDTPLAARFHKELVEQGFAPESFDIEDGLFSFYIDAITEQAGPSSYAPIEKMRRYSPVGNESLHQNLYDIFNSTPVTRPHHTIRDKEEDTLFG